MNAAIVVFAALLALSSAYPYHHDYHHYPYGYGHVGYAYHGHAHQVAVPVEYDTHPFVHDPTGNTVPYGGHGGDENLDGLLDIQDTNRDAKIDPATHVTGYRVGYVYHR